jgi:hypothetical protein
MYNFKQTLSGFLLLLIAVGFTACFDDLNTTPIDEDELIAANVYNDPGAYEQVLAKVYAGLALTGQQGEAGQPDISGIDEGFSSYLRQYWKLQTLTTDEAVIAWNDGNIHDLEDMDWNAANEFIAGAYYRIIYQVTIANEFIRESTEEKVAARGQQANAEEIAIFRAEARLLRALSYWHALDLFRNVPFVTENDIVGAFFPEQIQANELFAYIESELLAIEPLLVDARQNEYGRVDKAAAWMLLAKLYLNAEVYIGTNRAADALVYSKRVIDAGYELEPNFENLYVADNDQSPEAIFAIPFDGINTRTFGGMTFFTHAPVGGSMNPADFGIAGGWGGLRTTSALVNKFPSVGGGGQVVSEAVFPNNQYDLINVPGFYQGWNPENDSTALARKGDENVYEGYLYFAEGLDSYAFKFADGGWDTNWGDNGADGTLEPGGADLTAPAPGMYRVVFDLDNLTYTFDQVQWGLIGAATPGGWDADTDMTYDETLNAWTITVPLVGGQQYKFRANDGWDVNLGDSGADGTLENNGDNITIDRDGVYKINLFLNRPDYTFSVEIPSSDARAMFFTDGQTLVINDVTQFTQGYAVTRYRNVTRDGVAGSDLGFPDTDFMMFRLGDAYLMYAEAALRANDGGAVDQALGLVNELRQRAYGNASGNILRTDLDLDFIIDERARELYWEGQRRTDLVRFGLLTGDAYLWPLKGNALEGASVPAFRNVFPIPAADVAANPNLRQNEGY